MNKYAKFLTPLFFFLTLHNLTFGQMLKIEAEGPVFNLPEVEAIIAKQDGKIQVLFTHTDMRLEKYKDVDLKINDEIFMANGKKLATVEELEEMYNKLETGAVLKMAVKRDDKNKIISIVKADPKDLPKRKIKMETVSEDMPEAVTEKGEKKIIMKREKKKDE